MATSSGLCHSAPVTEIPPPLRIGVLGAARITPSALIKPARQVAGVTVAGVAARDIGRAERFAAEHGVAKVYPSYAELVDSPDIDAVYVPLPNSGHAEWTLKALAAGKHVLCEKPFTANAEEAREVAAAAAASGLVVMEAFHYRYHPLAERMRAIVHGESELGSLGRIRHIETGLSFPLVKRSDIRFQLGLAGGATMDAGCYAIHCLRLLGSGRPEVVSARAKLRSPQVDRAMTADFRFPDGGSGRITASLWSRDVLRISARVVGERGTMRAFNFVMPQMYHRLSTTVDGRTYRERVPGEATYTHQLRAFAAAVQGGDTNLTPPEDAIVTMSLIDDVYRAAGLRPRDSQRRTA